ncbi:PP0621 family protein [Paraburkholderia caballeronis]|uniref:PP0621 family protein n=1 Tax=Paraburkholderia caballeronis TaxID=416943 RepID=UPI0010666ABD|nr:PP0621 family protein [Paraburkholderia caballeronis]TDV09832.1 uncharacterized protein C7408_11451 [Paraburkholderia caballeronis]TDV14077.1 uncharacterized protein C7406_11551 [Paraburkholderia caballeronis]TDV23131.1 uncharacterized protein C7404_11451 [Paraburkholderia caballeronis]
MRQILLLILLFVVGQWFVKALRRAQAQERPDAPPQPAPPPRSAGEARRNGGARPRTARPASLSEPMVRCAECGVHAPRSESVTAVGQSFCCNEHARKYTARSAGQDRAAR